MLSYNTYRYAGVESQELELIAKGLSECLKTDRAHIWAVDEVLNMVCRSILMAVILRRNLDPLGFFVYDSILIGRKRFMYIMFLWIDKTSRHEQVVEHARITADVIAKRIGAYAIMFHSARTGWKKAALGYEYNSTTYMRKM